MFTLNPLELASTVPGVQTVPTDNQLSNGVNLQVDGARPRSNNFLLDSQEINDVGIGGQAFQPREAQQRPDGVRPDLRGPGPQSRGSPGGQVRDPGSGQDAELPGACIGEGPCLVKVAGHRGRGQAPLAGQPSPEPR